jgi:hypothetical protein
MSAILQNNFRVSAAKKFISQIGQTSNIAYVFIGKSTPWDNENSPPVPNNWVQTTFDAYDDMLFLKRIIPNDVHLVIRRNNWKRATIYETYAHNEELFDPARGIKPFYVVTDELNVYKCISNGYGKPSINKPTGRSRNIFSSGDGYLWKYMYSITSDLEKFVTPDFIPVPEIGSSVINDYGIEHIKIVNGGSGYTGSTINLNITGNGSNCQAYGKIENGVITEVVITNRGRGYRNASATCAAPPLGGTQATFNAIISPPGGHGSNPAIELGGHFVMMIARFNRDESKRISVSNDFRKIGIIENPKSFTGNNILTNNILSMIHKLHFSSVIGLNAFEPDEIVAGNISGASATVVDYDNVEQELGLINISGEFFPGEQLTGQTTGCVGILNIGANSSGTCQSGGISSVVLGTNAPLNLKKEGFSTVIRITGGKGAGQIKTLDVDSYDPNTKQINIIGFWELSLIPDSTSTYVISWIKYPDVAKDSGNLLLIEHRRPISRADDQVEEIKICGEW